MKPLSYLFTQKEAPLVSVILPAYNAEPFIERTLTSVLTQTYTNIEVLAIDDGSEDRTGQILESFAKNDSRVRLYKQKNAGVAAARNLAIEQSTGDYVAPIDADDIWYPQKLQKQVQCMLSAAPSVGLVYAWQVRIDEEDMILGPVDIQSYEDFSSVEGNVLPALVYCNFLGSASTPLIRRSCLQQVGVYNTLLKARDAQGCEDWDIYLRIAEQYEFRVVREFLIGYRQVESSMSRNVKAMAKSIDLVMSDLRPKHPEIPDYLYEFSASNSAIYLSGMSETCGDYASALIFALKSIRFDYIQLFLQPRRLTYLLKLILKLMLSPAVLWMGLDPTHWFREMKRKLICPHKDVAPNHVAGISDVQAQGNNAKLDPIERYGRVRWRRWQKILQMCQ